MSMSQYIVRQECCQGNIEFFDSLVAALECAEDYAKNYQGKKYGVYKLIEEIKKEGE